MQSVYVLFTFRRRTVAKKICGDNYFIHSALGNFDTKKDALCKLRTGGD